MIPRSKGEVAVLRPVVKGRGEVVPGGLNRLCGISLELQPIVGQSALPRTEVLCFNCGAMWFPDSEAAVAYVRKNSPQDPNNKRKIICNDELQVVFETDCTDMFKMNKLLAKHIIPLEATRQPAKKRKVSEDTGSRQTISCPSVGISETLANLFEVPVREMLQSEVFMRLW